MSSGNSIARIHFLSAHRGNASGSGFSGGVTADKRKQFLSKTDVANLSDNQILNNSIDYAERKSKTTLAGKITSALPTLFFAGAVAVFAFMKKGQLSDKVKAGLEVGAMLTAGRLLSEGYNDAIDRFENANKTFKNAREEHPVASAVAELAGFIGLFSALYAGTLKGANYLGNKFQPTAEALTESVAKASKKLDSTALAKKMDEISARYAGFKTKHPNLGSFMERNNSLAPYAYILSWMGLSNLVINKSVQEQAQFANERAQDLMVLREIAKNA